MSRGVLTFKRSDVIRAIKAAQIAGIDVHRVEIDRDGKIIVVIAEPATAAPQDDPNVNEWDTIK
jgi:hypothetical protein